MTRLLSRFEVVETVPVLSYDYNISTGSPLQKISTAHSPERTLPLAKDIYEV